MEVGRANGGGTSTEVSVNAAPRKAKLAPRQEEPREPVRQAPQAPQPENLGRSIDVKA